MGTYGEQGVDTHPEDREVGEMRIGATSEKFKFLFKLALNLKDNPTDLAILKFTPRGAILSDIWRDVVGIYALFQPTFFDQYNVDKEEVVGVSKNFVKMSSHLRGLNYTIFTDNGYLVVESGNERYREPLPNVEFQNFPFELEFSEYIKPKKQEASVIGKVTIDELHSLPDLPYIQFVSDGATLIVRLISSLQQAQQGIFEAKPNFQFTRISPLTLTLNNEFFSTLIEPLTGSVWIVLDKAGISVSQIMDDYALLICLAGLI
jgi:hypothetical protein